MNRKIEFRAWFKEEKKMYGVSEIHFSLEGIKYIVCCDLETYDRPYFYVDLKDIELIQYTGLKDTNGVKIFEGDIVQINDDWDTYGMNAGEKYEIYFYAGGFRCKPKYNAKSKGYWLDDGNDVVVLGNIYENPELLEVA